MSFQPVSQQPNPDRQDAYPTVWFIIVATVAGCFQPPPTPQAKTEVPPIERRVEAETKAEVKQAVPVPAVPPVTAHEPMESEGGESAPEFGTERVVLLLPHGPLVVQFRLSIDGHPHDQAMESLIDSVWKTTHAEPNDRLAWEDLLSNPRFRFGQFGNVAAKDAGERQRITRLYDVNRNGLVERDELPRFVTRNSGGARPFAFSASNFYFGENRTKSRLRMWLDVNGDGLLDAEELSHAPIRLRARDPEDDDVLVPSDFKVLVANDDGQLPNQRRTSDVDNAFAIHSQTRWELLDYALRERYAGSRELQRADLAEQVELFELLDGNRNDRIEKAEVANFERAPAELVVDCRLGTLLDPASARLVISNVAESLRPRVQRTIERPGRVVIELTRVKLEFFLNDFLQTSSVDAEAKRLMTQLDANQNGYLEASEFSAQELPGIRLEAVDANSDQKVFPEELTSFLQQRQAPARSQIRARVADVEDAYFSALDSDGDGRLNGREVLAAASRLLRFDADGDGTIRSNEIPESIVIGVVRGEGDREARLFVPPPIVANDSRDLPDWFTAMDTNGDGDVGRGEFLGPAAKFDALDQDHDGFLSAQEVLVK